MTSGLKNLVPVKTYIAVVIAASSTLSCYETRARPSKASSNPPDIGGLVLSDSGEKHRVSPEQPVQVGSGYNTITETVAGDCMERSSLTTLSDDHSRSGAGSSLKNSPATAGNQVIITYLEDYRRLAEELGVKASARARFFIFSVSAEAEYANGSDFSKNSSFLIATATMRKETERLKQYRIKEDALALLRSNPRAFFRRCGNQFVAGRIKGASFTAVVEIRDTTEATRTAVRGKVGAGLSLGGFGAEASVEGTKALEQELAQHELHYKVMSVGLPADNPTSIDGFIRTALSLQGTIDESANKREAAIEFVTQSYDIADNFPGRVNLPSLVTQDQFLERLASFHQETAITLRDLERGLRYPKDRPCANSERRRQGIIANLEASNRRVAERAHACANDPERMCNQDNIPDPSFVDARLWLSECSDLEAHLLAKKQELEQADQAKRESAEAERRSEEARARASAELARRRRGLPGGLLCENWLLTHVEVEVPYSQPTGGQWDDNGSKPDLYVRVKIGSLSRDTPYQENSTKASFDMEPPIPMKTQDKIQLWAWDFDGNGFFGPDVESAVSTTAIIPGWIAVSGMKVANVHGTFTLYAKCNDQGESQDVPDVFGGRLGRP